MTVEWKSNGWVATGVPCFDKIEVDDKRAVLYPAFTYSEIHGKIMPQSFDVEHLTQLRDALSQAITHMTVWPANVSRVARQWWNGSGDPPKPEALGFEVVDKDEDTWTLVSHVRARMGESTQAWTRLDQPSLNFRDVSWEQLLRFVPLTEVLKGDRP
jgi:hypothetical protein